MPGTVSDAERQPLLAETQPDDEHGEGNVDPLTLSRRRRFAILASIWTAAFLSSLNATMVATLVSSISSDFERAHQASWLGTSFLVATSTFTPLYGRLSNALGRRGANQAAIAFCGLGTLLCGVAPTMNLLVLGRFLAGIGGGGIFTTMSIITADMYSLRDRSMTQGIANIFTGLGMGIGGPFGGIINDRLGWRWAFLLQMPLFVVAFVLSFNIRYTTPGKGKSKLEVLKRVDWLGSGVLLAFVLSLLFFLSFKYQTDLPWSEWRVILPLVVAAVSSVAFVLVELYVAETPVLAPFLLRQRIPVLVGISNFLVAFCNFSIIYFFPMWFEVVALKSATVAGLHLLPNSIAMTFGSLFAGYYLQKTGKYKMLNVICGVFPTIAAVLVARLRQDSGPIAQWLSIITLGFGNAVVLQTTLIALLASMSNLHMAIAIGFGQLWRGIGQVSGVAVSSAVFQHILERELSARFHGPGSQELITRIRHSSKLVASLPLDEQVKAQASYAIALRTVFTIAAVSTFSAFLVRLPIPEQSLDEEPAKTPTSTTENSAQISPEGTRPTTPSTGSRDASSDAHSLLRKANSFAHGSRAHVRAPKRSVSTYERGDGVDPEEEDDEDEDDRRVKRLTSVQESDD